MKKYFLLVLVLFFLAGCIEDKPKTKENIFLEVKEISVNAEQGFGILELAVSLFSNGEAKKTRIEIFDSSDSLLCFNYFDLNKGLNTISFKCDITSGKISIKLTPSNSLESFYSSKQFVFERKIDFSKGVMLNYEIFWNEPVKAKVYYNIYITDENDSWWNGIIVGKFPKWFLTDKDEETETVIALDTFEINKQDNSFHGRGILTKEMKHSKETNYNIDPFLNERAYFLLPFYFYVLNRVEDKFNLKNFLESKTFSSPNYYGFNYIEIQDNNCDYKGIKCLKVDIYKENVRVGEILISSKEPYIVLKTGDPVYSLNLVSIEKKEFDLNYYSEIPSIK
ncbi:MAG: hypothetical protein AB1467_01840 [Candidatus Diapherotrites archaeon]